MLLNLLETELILVKAKTNKGGKEANLDEVIVTVKDTGTGIES